MQTTVLCLVLSLSLSALVTSCGGSPGNPVAPTPMIPNVQGVWTGESTQTSCDDPGNSRGFCSGFSPVGTVLPVRLTLSQAGAQLSGNCECPFVIPVTGMPITGVVNASGRVVLNGNASFRISEVGPNITAVLTIVNWDTTVAGANMTGTWRVTIAVNVFTAVVNTDYRIRVLTNLPLQPTSGTGKSESLETTVIAARG